MSDKIKFTVIITTEEYMRHLENWKEYVKSLSIGKCELSIYQTSYEIRFPNFEDWLIELKRYELNNMTISNITVNHNVA